jgi:hypothetical protein
MSSISLTIWKEVRRKDRQRNWSSDDEFSRKKISEAQRARWAVRKRQQLRRREEFSEEGNSRSRSEG